MVGKKIGEILLEKKLITETQLKEALDIQMISREFLGEILIKKKIISENDLMKALSAQFNIPFVSLKDETIDWDLSVKYFSTMSANTKALPIFQDERTVIVAIRDPLDKLSLSSIEESIRPKKIKLVLVAESELADFIKECRRRARGSLKQLLDDK